MCKEIDNTDPNLNEASEDCSIWMRSDTGYESEAHYVKDTFDQEKKGNWSIKDNQLRLTNMNDGVSSFSQISDWAVPSDWSNINTTYWNANRPGSDQIETRIETDYTFWLLESGSGRWVFYVKETNKTVLANTAYLVNSSLPVTETTTYSKRTFYDDSRLIPFTESEVVGTWAFNMDVDLIDAPSYYYRNNTVSDVATFNADGTGVTKTTNRNFTWKITEAEPDINARAGRLQIQYEAEFLEVVILTKYAEFANSYSVHSRTLGISGVVDGKLIYERSSRYKFAIKDDGASSVD